MSSAATQHSWQRPVASASKTDTTGLEGISKRKMNGETHQEQIAGANKKTKATSVEGSDGEDDEWAVFQREVLSKVTEEQQSDAVGRHSVGASRSSSLSQGASAQQAVPSVYATATVEVAPQLRSRPGDGAEEAEELEAEDEEERRQRLLREEKEEIFSRLDAEQQQQEEAEQR